MIKLKRINGQSIFEIPIETLKISSTLKAFFKDDQSKIYIFGNEKYEDKTISRFAQFMHLFHNKAIHYKDYNEHVDITKINELLSEAENEYLNGIDLYTAVQLINVAEETKIYYLMQLMIIKISNVMKGKTKEEIKKDLNIVFTYEPNSKVI